MVIDVQNARDKCIMCLKLRQLSGLVVERLPAVLKVGVQTWGGEPKNFQYRLSSAETQQSVDRMRRKARGCLVLSVLC